MFRIAHLSDPHFGTERPEVAAALLDLVPRLAPDLVVLSGDITQRARRRQFDAAAVFIAALAPLPLLAVPGNHDIPLFNLLARACWPYRGYRRVFGETLAPTFAADGVRVAGFDSTSPRRHKHGALDPAAVASRFGGGEAFQVAVFHHPLDSPRPADEVNLIRPAAPLASALAERRVDLVLGGHIHDPLAVSAHRRYPRLPWAPVLVLAGTCLSTRIRADTPNSFNLLELEAGATPLLSVERWDWRGRGFAPCRRQLFARDGQHGWSERQAGPRSG
jgi:3',5'-cyclic AMP phosphodiesterase CpdA